MTKSRDEILDLLFRSVREVEGDAVAHVDRADFPAAGPHDLNMDSLNLLEVEMMVSAELDQEIEFPDLRPGIRFEEIADAIVLKLQQL